MLLFHSENTEMSFDLIDIKFHTLSPSHEANTTGLWPRSSHCSPPKWRRTRISLTLSYLHRTLLNINKTCETCEKTNHCFPKKCSCLSYFIEIYILLCMQLHKHTRVYKKYENIPIDSRYWYNMLNDSFN